MAVTVLVGVQWGDEGKGKIIDVMTEQADLVVRFQGGNNAGHTVYIGEEKFVLHLIPSGILRPDSVCVIGNGLVVNPYGLTDEIDMLEGKGIEIGDRLQLSSRAHLVFPHHLVMDGFREGKQSIGTTRRGIGPAYADKVGRTGVRAVNLTKPDVLKEKFLAQAEQYNTIFAANGVDTVDAEAEWPKLEAAAARLAPLVTDTVLTVNNARKAGQSLLFEGAQGMWLDIDYGTYPYVTSSNTTAGGACTGGGIAPRWVDHVVGVAKAYCTRVGEGPFPTELLGAAGDALREAGKEYGATTGRPRRCGWFDAVSGKYSVLVNGVDNLAITKMDVLDDMPAIKICSAYEIDGERITDMPSDTADLSKIVPVYDELPGWQSPTTHVTSWDGLPANAQNYLRHLSELVEADIGSVSTGPERAQTFFING